MNKIWTLPSGEDGVFESIKVTELGHVMARFVVGVGDEAVYVNCTVGKIDDMFASNGIFNIKNMEYATV